MELAALYPYIKDLKVLIVDDHMVMRRLLENNLREMGFEHIAQASGYEEAAAHMASNKVDVLFLDWHMPGKSGYQLLQEYRSERAFDDTAFVMVTAEFEERSVVEALKAGATSYVVKPFSQSTFQEHIKNIMKWVDRRKEQQAKKATQK